MKSLVLFIVLLMPSSAFAQRADRWWVDVSILASGVAASADLSTTSWALGKDSVTFRESNPILRPFSHDPVVLAVAKGSIDGVSIWWMVKHHKKHPRLVTAVALAKTALSGYVAHRNAKAVGLR